MATIHWLNAVDGDFADAGDWAGGIVPGAGDRAVLGAIGAAHYTVTAAGNETVTSLRVDATATLAITGGVFTLGGDRLDNSGVISLDGAAGGAVLSFSGDAILDGGGLIMLSEAKTNYINLPDQAHAGTLTNLDNTISGAGRIGGRGLFFNNDAAGVVSATGTHSLILEGFIDTNAGKLQGVGRGGLALKKVLVEDTASGVISAADGSKVRLRHAFIDGGTLSSVGSGKFVVRGQGRFIDGDSGLDGLSGELVISARVVQGAGTSLQLSGSIANIGSIEMARHGKSDLFIRDGGVILTGGGAIEMREGDRLFGVDATATLTNSDNTISGAGALGGGVMTLDNLSGGVIDADRSAGLVIDTGAATITNAGVIKATREGRGTVLSAVDNSGVLMAARGGRLSFQQTVTGTGSAMVNDGTLAFAQGFNEDVAFTAATGVLQLGQSQGYTGSVTGFSKTGGTTLDLADIGFVSSAEATFSGSKSGGVLTVTDGVHTATITLVGNYRLVTFVASDDGNGGVDIVDSIVGRAATPISPHRFVAAMAGLASPAGGAIHTDRAAPVHEPMLFKPRAMIA